MAELPTGAELLGGDAHAFAAFYRRREDPVRPDSMNDTEPMITLGIDLAAQGKKTAACRLLWQDDGSVSLFSLDRGFDDYRLLELMSDVDAVGIDAPFGFPRDAVQAQATYAAGQSFPKRPEGLTPDEWSLQLRYRATDRFVQKMLLERRGAKVWPLSVSSDRIAICAWRCAGLLGEIAANSNEPQDRAGSWLFEVYPAASLTWWGLPAKGYKPGAAGSPKSIDAEQTRSRIIDQLMDGLDGRLALSEAERSRLRGDDDLLDAFIAALTTRAAATGATHAPPDTLQGLAAEEGWIHIPDCARRFDEIVFSPTDACAGDDLVAASRPERWSHGRREAHDPRVSLSRSGAALGIESAGHDLQGSDVRKLHGRAGDDDLDDGPPVPNGSTAAHPKDEHEGPAQDQVVHEGEPRPLIASRGGVVQSVSGAGLTSPCWLRHKRPAEGVSECRKRSAVLRVSFSVKPVTSGLSAWDSSDR